jgi:hypothetical protein
MSSYRSAYESYYKNINNTAKQKRDKNKYSIWPQNKDSSARTMYGANTNNITLTNFLIKRIIGELTGATILLFFFVALKYIPTAQIQNMHTQCKQALSYNLNYDQYIDVFDTIQIGNIKGKDLKIGNITTDDLKMENLKAKALSFIEYLKNNQDIQN